MQKPLSQRMHERAFGGSPLSTGLSPRLVAQSFGVVLPVAESLPQSAAPTHLIGEAPSSDLLIDSRKADAKPALKSISSIAYGRLQSIKPTTRERAQQVAQLIADLQEPLEAVDKMVEILQGERVEAIEQHAEQLKDRGRELRTKIESQLQATLYTAINALNKTMNEKQRCEERLRVSQDERRAVKKDRFATDKQKTTADENIKKAASALVIAQQQEWKCQEARNDAENVIRMAQAELSNIEKAIDQCAAEISGIQYHDPATGLAVDPTSYLQQ